MAVTTMVVGSKLAMPIKLQLQVEHAVNVNVGGAVHQEKLRVFDPSPDAEIHVVSGFSRHHAKVPDARIVGAKRATDGGSIGGYALTYVPKDFWDKWAAQNKDFPPLKAGFLIAFEKQDTVEGIAREKVDVMSGMEPFNPDRPPSEFARKITRADAA